MNAGVIIYNILKNNADVTNIVGSGDNCRVFPLITNQSYDIPFITYQNITTLPNATKSGPSTLDEKFYQLNIVANTPESCTALAEAVRAALDYATYNNGDNTAQQIYFSDERDDWNNDAVNDGVCMIQQDYRLLIER